VEISWLFCFSSAVFIQGVRALPADQSITHTGLRLRIREFQDGDYPRHVEIVNLAYPDHVWTVEEARHRDMHWDYTRYVQVRVVAESDSGIVGIGRINHLPDEFHPRKYWLEVAVDPAARRQGIGGALYTWLLNDLRARGAIAARAGVSREIDQESIGFLTRRGFVVVQRGWQSRLDVAAFEFERFAGAEDRAASQGIVLTTLAVEQVHDPEVLRRAYALTMACEQDVPSTDPVTETSFEHFLAHAITSPNALPEAFFLARSGGSYVGMSAMYRPAAEPGIIYQGLTGVLREYRGRGIAMALKLQTVRYARDHGYREIRTWNDTRNRLMLRINEAMGFVKQPASINFEKALGA
jgi:GNAT superfamily N-acetyltransferase